MLNSVINNKYKIIIWIYDETSGKKDVER